MDSGSQMIYKSFLFSSMFIQSILGLRPGQSPKEQLFLFCAIIFYVFPLISHQFYQLFTSEIIQQLVELRDGTLQKMIGIIILFSVYSSFYFNFVKVKLIYTDLITSCKQVSNEKELAFLEENVKQSKLYAYVILGLSSGYVFVVVTPYVVKVCLYFLGILDDNQLSLIFPVNNVNKAGAPYFFLLIYQIIVCIIMWTVGGVCFAVYLTIIIYACYQFRVLIFKIQRPFERNLKYTGKNYFFRTPQDEWDWIIDIINGYKKVTE